jgi:hypothetical protein
MTLTYLTFGDKISWNVMKSKDHIKAWAKRMAVLLSWHNNAHAFYEWPHGPEGLLSLFG